MFAVWAVRRSCPDARKAELLDSISHSLALNESRLDSIGTIHGARIQLTAAETTEYLQGFNYRLGERERSAMKLFKKLVAEVMVAL